MKMYYSRLSITRTPKGNSKSFELWRVRVVESLNRVKSCHNRLKIDSSPVYPVHTNEGFR